VPRSVRGVEDLGTVLSVWAHPDDETYLAAGLMALSVQMGRRVVCVTATRGELGSTDAERWPPGESLARIRTAELEECMAALGVTEHHWLDYPDGGCADVDEAEAVSRIRKLALDVRPDTVVTFGPDGITGHSDHQTVSRWVDSAVLDIDPRPRLLHAAHTEEFLERFREPLDKLGVYMGFEPPSVPQAQASYYLKLEGDILARKQRALSAQRSQTEALIAALGQEYYTEGLSEEAFVDG